MLRAHGCAVSSRASRDPLTRAPRVHSPRRGGPIPFGTRWCRAKRGFHARFVHDTQCPFAFTGLVSTLHGPQLSPLFVGLKYSQPLQVRCGSEASSVYSSDSRMLKMLSLNSSGSTHSAARADCTISAAAGICKPRARNFRRLNGMGPRGQHRQVAGIDTCLMVRQSTRWTIVHERELNKKMPAAATLQRAPSSH